MYISSRATVDGQHTDFVTTLSDAELLQDWIDSTAEFLKSLDSNHLITVGSEGFLGSSTPGKNLLVPSIASLMLTTNLVDSMPHSMTFIDYFNDMSSLSQQTCIYVCVTRHQKTCK